MATRPEVSTRTTIRAELVRALGENFRLIKYLEDLGKDVSQTLPNAALAAAEDIEAAQTLAESASQSASDAQSSAATALAVGSAAKNGPLLLWDDSSDLPNALVLEFDPLVLKTTDAAGVRNVTSADVVAILAADISDTSASLVSTPLSIALSGNATYIVEGLVVFRSAAVTTGLSLALLLPAGASISGGFTHPTSSGAVGGSYSTSPGAVAGPTAGVPATNTNIPATCRWVVKTGTAGTGLLQFCTGVAGSAVTLKADLTALVARRVA